MTRRNFRDLLLAYLTVAIVSAAYGLYVGVTAGKSAAELVTKSTFDQDIEKEIREFQRLVADRQSSISTITTITVVLVIASWVGLFKFWKPARILFCAYLFFAYLLRPFWGSGFEELPVDSELYGFYCSIFMERPGAVANILATVNIAFDTVIVVAIFSTPGKKLFASDGSLAN